MSSSPDTLRVLHLGSPTRMYGAERWILALVRYLPARVESLIGAILDAPGGEPEICARANEMGLRTITISAPGKLSLPAIGQLRDFIRSNDIHILHTHGYKTDILGAFAVRGTNCRIISTPHGWSTNAGLNLRIYEALDRAAFYLHDAVVPLSQDIYQGLARLPGLKGRLHLIQNGVDLGEVDAASRHPDIPAGLRNGKGFLFGYIGQLIPRKGLLTLLNAFSRVEDETARLCLVGEGEQREELEQAARQLGIADRTMFLGYRADRLEILKCFDAFVLPSTLEGIPRCVLESMAAGIPVITSDIPGCIDVVKHGTTGLLAAVGNDAEFADRMQSLIRSPAKAGELADAAEHFVRTQFSAAAMADSYSRLYGQLVPGRTTHRTPLQGSP